ncbi:hypothetical protein PAQ31011_00809 [Pandoraea aquatica]|uniref:Uncharacterized protein n=1 Tax=Pandoraea aquatica TaxID=2508290 RepID=A0A5E4SJ22_9BURK|nr:hypothetical protein [Pandoraea aquatica]VVD74782.1 hypothetical protein PAQ31011_00809 [Pandoraea aquatica]
MTPSRFESKLRGQSAIAQKVFEAVPIQECWTLGQIGSALIRTTRASIDMRILQGCLAALRDVGLVQEVKTGHYRRVQVKPTATADKTVAIQTKEKVVVTNEPKSPIDLLSAITKRLAALHKHVEAETKAIASEIETAALSIEEGIEKTAGEAAKFKQLQKLLADAA